MSSDGLNGLHLLVVEDDYLLASGLQEALELEGATVVGPCPDVLGALRAIAQAPVLDGALLDVNLGDETSFAVVEALRGRGVPMLFLTGYDDSALPAAYSAIPRCRKPVGLFDLVRELSSLVVRAG
ncbi:MULTISPECIES: response regulator [unclassified Lysobacter]|uniref:response regulator n=1 Tax=unclassified Lysobacter TaxID=2635362 RepID=UPI001C218A13|nr:response regulator [Lysobacter sp. MMG2]MBU8978055.1 response regulator [Lysobacter sp. MMG2]